MRKALKLTPEQGRSLFLLLARQEGPEVIRGKLGMNPKTLRSCLNSGRLRWTHRMEEILLPMATPAMLRTIERASLKRPDFWLDKVR